MEQSLSSEANRFSSSQDIPRILWYPKVHFRNHKTPPPIRILSQLDPVHTRTHLRLDLPSFLFPSCLIAQNSIIINVSYFIWRKLMG